VQGRRNGAPLDPEDGCDLLVVEVGVVAQEQREPLPLRQLRERRAHLGEVGRRTRGDRSRERILNGVVGRVAIAQLGSGDARELAVAPPLDTLDCSDRGTVHLWGDCPGSVNV
jgi:hypothetical protein